MSTDDVTSLDAVVALIPAPAVVFMVVMGAVALVQGWRLFWSSQRPRHRLHAMTPPVDVIEQGIEGVR